MDKEQFLDWDSDIIKVKTELLFYGSVLELEEYLNTAENCLAAVRNSTNIRLIVLETWLFLDYSIRLLLMGAFSLGKYNHEEYDLRYNLLPRSFEACLTLLLKLKKTNKELLPNPENNRILFPMRFLLFLKKEHKDFLEKLIEKEKEYYQKNFPLLSKENNKITVSSVPNIKIVSNNYRRISDTWLEAVAGIDEEWSNKATKLNGARNLAAHSYDVQKIAARLGYTGKRASELVTTHCMELLEQMIGIVSKPKDKSKS